MEEKSMKMSVQFMKSVMLAFQKTIKEQCNIMDIFQSFDIVESNGELIVLNPPVFKVDSEKEE